MALDFCSGKSGDLNKLQLSVRSRANLISSSPRLIFCTSADFGAQGVSHVVSVDFARGSLIDAASRYNQALFKNRRNMCSYEFIHANCFEADLPAALPSTTSFDFAQCQFAIHYAFDSEQHVRRALENATARLKTGAFFVGTTTDSRVIMRKLRESSELHIGNSLCRLEWLGKTLPSGAIEIDSVYGSLGVRKDNPFGYKCDLDCVVTSTVLASLFIESLLSSRYIFKLEDAIDEVAESLVDFGTFERLALEYGLECQMSSNFHEFFHSHCEIDAYRKLFCQMSILGEDSRVPADTWDIARTLFMSCTPAMLFSCTINSTPLHSRRHVPRICFQKGGTAGLAHFGELCGS